MKAQAILMTGVLILNPSPSYAFSTGIGFIDNGVRELEKGGRAIGGVITEGGKVFGEVIRGVYRAHESVINAHGQVFNAAGKEVTIFGENVAREGQIGLQNAGREFNKGIQNVIREVTKAGGDLAWNVDKGLKDAEANIAKSGRDVEEAGHAIGHYVERKVQSYGDVISETADRMREGKFVDAIWHSALDPLNNDQENLAIAASESSIVRTVGQVAASAYGGPKGAAAYAAWLTYHQTGGNINAAIQVGIITGVTAQAFADLNTGMAANNYSVDQKALVMASIGGLSVAAAGGSPDQIRDGFLAAGAMVYVQDHYQEKTKAELNEKSMRVSNDKPPYCLAGDTGGCTPVPEGAVLERDANGHPIKIDYSKADINARAVGLAGSTNDVTGEKGFFMGLVSKAPGMNGMATMHDNWVVDWHLNDYAGANQATIVPAILVYYTGTGAPYYEIQREAVIERQLREKVYADAGKPLPPAPQKVKPQLAVKPTPADVVDAYMCGFSTSSNQMVVEEYEKPNPYACKVLYFDEMRGTSKEIWRAKNDPKYCEGKATELVQKMKNIGMTCLYQAGTKRLLAERRIAKR